MPSLLRHVWLSTACLAALAVAGCGRGEGAVLDPVCPSTCADSATDGPTTDGVPEDGDSGFVPGITLAAGIDATCATRAGVVWCWGDNSDSALVPGGGDLFVPTRVGADADWLEISGAHGHCGLKNDKHMQCWGPDDAVPNAAQTAVPTAVEPSVQWAHSFAGVSHHCGIALGGTLRCWGANDVGQLGLGDTNVRTSVVTVPGTWSTACVGRVHTCALSGGALSCWGGGAQGQLGLGDGNDRHTPTPVGARSDWTSISCGYNHTCAIAADHSLWCWGENAYGEVGAGDTAVHKSPVQVGSNYLAVSGGEGVSCAIANDHTLWCFGDFGQEPAKPGQSHSPVQFDANPDWETIAAGRSHACGVRTGVGVLCLGYNFAGQLAQPKTTAYSGTAIPVAFAP